MLQLLPPNRTALANLFSQAPFDVLELEQRACLEQNFRLFSFEACDELFAQGQRDVPFCYICAGQLKLSSSAAQGRECVLHIIRPGTVLDVSVLFFEGGLPYAAVALTEGSYCVFEREVIFKLMSANFSFVAKLMRMMAARQRLFINKLVGSQGRISVSCRVSSWLLHRAKMEHNDELHFDIGRELMARLLGVTRESLSRELSRLAELGYIRVERRCIVLLEKKALQKLAIS
ncbi:MAG: Crp/Fnr family transcriptional regulator [Desulfovibrio sp.]|nr:Crp/Fnr family transcriptional regulator [Desulfovibrio sp.]